MITQNATTVLFALAIAGCAVLTADSARCQQVRTASDTSVGRDSSIASGTTIIPFPFAFYTPETDVGFGATLVTLFRLTEDESRNQPSSIAPLFLYTLKDQVIAVLDADLILDGGRYRVNANLGYSYYPNTFWGVGNDSPDSAEEDYIPRTREASIQVLRRVAPGWYLGGAVRYGHRRLVEIDSAGLLATAGVPGTEDGRVVSSALLLTWDTRDNTVYPRSGGYRQLELSVSDSVIGSDYDFVRYTLDVRQYVPLFSKHLLALRGLAVAASGTPPFDVLAQLGGEDLVRGYYAGRYRDRNLLALQLEYRMPVWWRIGAIGFASVGQVSHEIDDFKVGGFKPAAGFGLRFLLSPAEGLNLRADWGFGSGSSGFYIGMAEVF